MHNGGGYRPRSCGLSIIPGLATGKVGNQRDIQRVNEAHLFMLNHQFNLYIMKFKYAAKIHHSRYGICK